MRVHHVRDFYGDFGVLRDGELLRLRYIAVKLDVAELERLDLGLRLFFPHGDGHSVPVDPALQVFSQRGLRGAFQVGWLRRFTLSGDVDIDEVAIVEGRGSSKRDLMVTHGSHGRRCGTDPEHSNILASAHGDKQAAVNIVDLSVLAVHGDHLESGT